MSDVYEIFFSLFNTVVSSMKKIPIADGVSMYDFSLALIILSVVALAVIPIVKIGSMSENSFNGRIADRIERKK